MKLLRTICLYAYLAGYAFLHIPLMRRVEKVIAAGNGDSVRKTVEDFVQKGCETALKIAGILVFSEGKENIPAGPCVFVANHRSYFDCAFVLVGLDKPHGVMAKAEVERIPLINRWMKALGCVFVVREDVRASMRALYAAADRVKEGQSFVIFPEGTTIEGEEGCIGTFKGGAFRAALKAGAPIVPVAIRGAVDCFEKNHYLCGPADITMHILPAVETRNLSRAEQKELPEKVQKIIHDELQRMVKA